MERCKRPNAVRKSRRYQAEKQFIIDSSLEVNRNNHITNEVCDQFVGGVKFLPTQFLLGYRVMS